MCICDNMEQIVNSKQIQKHQQNETQTTRQTIHIWKNKNEAFSIHNYGKQPADVMDRQSKTNHKIKSSDDRAKQMAWHSQQDIDFYCNVKCGYDFQFLTL